MKQKTQGQEIEVQHFKVIDKFFDYKVISQIGSNLVLYNGEKFIAISQNESQELKIAYLEILVPVYGEAGKKPASSYLQKGEVKNG